MQSLQKAGFSFRIFPFLFSPTQNPRGHHQCILMPYTVGYLCPIRSACIHAKRDPSVTMNILPLDFLHFFSKSSMSLCPYTVIFAPDNLHASSMLA